MMSLAPIILFVYNRLWHTQQTVNTLLKNELAKESEIFIFSDGPKNENAIKDVKKIREYIAKINGFKKISIIKNSNNLGLADSIIRGVTEIIDQYGKVIVLEDDLVSSKNILKFMNNALEYYQNHENVFSISGYRYPGKISKKYQFDVFLYPRFTSWGWATWQDRWEKAEWELKDFNDFIKDRKLRKKFNEGGDEHTYLLNLYMQKKINSWAIRWGYTHFKNNAFCVLPVISKIQNIGTDKSGVHCAKTNKFTVELDDGYKQEWKFTNDVNLKVIKEIRKIFNYKLKKRIKNSLKSYYIELKDYIKS